MLTKYKSAKECSIAGFMMGFAIAAIAWLAKFVAQTYYAPSSIPVATITATIWAIVLISVVLAFFNGLKLKTKLTPKQGAFLDGFAMLFTVLNILQGLVTGNLLV